MTEADFKEEVFIQGIAASSGVAHGRAFVHHQNKLDIPHFDLADDQVEAELARFEQAILETRSEILEVRDKTAKSLGEGEARIFDAHLLVLEDNAVLDEVTAELRKSKKNIEFCYHNVTRRYIEFFQSTKDEYLRERVADVNDVMRRMLHNLIGIENQKLRELSEDGIIVSEDISPSNAADLNRDKLLGFVTDFGGQTSHAVIMARSLHIPAVVGTHDATKKIKNGDCLIVDGDQGLVIINPRESRLQEYSQLASKRKERNDTFNAFISEPVQTLDGVRIRLMANVEGVDEMKQARDVNAEGVGLFRTEGVFLRYQGYPPESFQYDKYRAVIEAAGEHPVIIRTLDIGGDKTIGLDRTTEDSSFMGLRAIRFCLKNEEIFRTQLRAILRASQHGHVKIMYPMISGMSELRQANQILESVKKELREKDQMFDEAIEVGVMIEIPSAAAIIDLISVETDFLSIGTNDLIQYLVAADRLDDQVAHLYDPAHPAVLRTLKAVIDGANQSNTPVSVCGEIAGDPVYAGLLLGMGVDSLSLSSSFLPEVKYFIRHIKKSDAEALVDRVMQNRDSAEVVRDLEAFRQQALGELA